MARAWAPQWRRFERWISWAAWIGLAVEVVLWLVLSNLSIDNPLLLLLAGAVLILGTWSCTAALIIYYRQIFKRWYGFALLVAALVLVTWGDEIVPVGNVANLLLMATVGLMPALPLSLVLLFWRQRDVSAELVGLVLLVYVWVVLLASIPYGGPIRALLQYLTTGGTGQFWWFETLTCLTMIVLPLGSIAFAIHLVRLLAKELQAK